MEPGKYYTDKLREATVEETRLSQILGWLSLFRLAAMISGIYLIVRAVSHQNNFLFGFGALCIILFFILVSHYKKKGEERKIAREKILLNRNELEALKGNFSSFYDGSQFLNPDHEFTYDLDIFGQDSLYQYLCRCCTLEGRKILASWLLTSPFERNRIRESQEIYEELAKNPDFIQNYLCSGRIIEEKENELDQVRTWLKREKKPFSTISHLLAVILMATNTGLLIAGLLIPGILAFLIISIVLSWLFYGFHFAGINRYHSEFGRKQEVIFKYKRLSLLLSREKFMQIKLKDFARVSGNSLRSIHRLEIIMDLFDTRLNLLVGGILNTFFLLDFHLIHILERWKKTNRTLLEEVFLIHSEMDAYFSGAIYRFNHPEFCKAKVVEKGLKTKAIGHPLVEPEKCILNDFQFDEEEKIIIVTGANMAGKSTFLRTLGVNIILAGTGMPVMAEYFEFEPIPIISGMRTTDSLAESESYFFAELKRLKKIMDKLRHKEKIYVLLDEILKGTNSIDKHKGSEELLMQMAKYPCMVFIATHDLQLGNLERVYPSVIKNYHFESVIEGDELKFDYKLKLGIAHNMNASFLLRKMGVLNDNAH